MFFSTYPEIVVNFGKTNLLFYDLINQQKIIMSRDEFPCIESFVNIDLENYPQFMKSFKYLKDNDFGYYLDTPHYNEQILTQKSSILKTDTLNEFTLRRISIELTGRCDLNCVFCNPNDLGYSSCMCKKWNGTETFDNFWLDILTQAIELGIDECFICGGDPLIKMELLQEIICFLNNNNIKITIFTNGVHMSEEFIQYIADKNITISLQTFSLIESTFNSITQTKNYYANFIKSIKLMNEYNIPYIISLIVLDENEEEISQTINLFPDIPLQKIYIYPKNKHYSKKYLNEMLSSDFRQFPIDIYSHQFTKNFHNCLYGQIAVDSDGIVYPCMMMKSYPIGSLKEEHLWEIFFNKKHKPFWNLPKRDLNVCKECELNLTCFDCRALDAQATGNLKDMVYCNK